MELLQDKVAIVTGAASPRGIGKQTARRFSDAGCRTAIVDLDTAASAAAANDIGSSHRGYGCDVANPNACQDLIKQVLADFG